MFTEERAAGVGRYARFYETHAAAGRFAGAVLGVQRGSGGALVAPARVNIPHMEVSRETLRCGVGLVAEPSTAQN
jgi:hypothetical protein